LEWKKNKNLTRGLPLREEKARKTDLQWDKLPRKTTNGGKKDKSPDAPRQSLAKRQFWRGGSTISKAGRTEDNIRNHTGEKRSRGGGKWACFHKTQSGVKTSLKKIQIRREQTGEKKVTQGRKGNGWGCTNTKQKIEKNPCGGGPLPPRRASVLKGGTKEKIPQP